MDKTKKLFDKTIEVPVTKEMWEKLRKLAYEEHTSMNAIVRDGIKIILKKYEKSS